MKGFKKKFLGLLGLGLVVAMTTYAAFLPQPDAAAVSTSATDQISVRVVGALPRVAFTGPGSGSRFTRPNVNLTLDYEDVDGVTIKLVRIDDGGNRHEHQLDKFYADYHAGSWNKQLDLDQYGYGDYLVTVVGEGFGSLGIVSDTIEFHYNVVEGNVDGKDPNGNPVIDPGVDPNDKHVRRVEFKVYAVEHEGDMGGELVPELSPLEVTAPFDATTLPFSEQQLPYGWYRVEIHAFDEFDSPVGEYQNFWILWNGPEKGNNDSASSDDEELPVPLTGAPNTGRGTGVGQMSQSDTVITTMIVFALVSGFAIVMVVKRKSRC